MARGSDYRLRCLDCGRVTVLGKHPGRREYFNGSDADYIAGTILELPGFGITDTHPG